MGEHEKKLERMKELTAVLNQASRAYYQEAEEILSNYEYDKLYDELSALEAETGVVMAGSPTSKVGYEIISELPKEAHEKPMLSLDKTKEVESLREWIGQQKGLLSWKLDGLTIVLTYQNGKLEKAVTRGNGEVGEVVTQNVKVFQNVPLTIPFKGEFILRGEAIIGYRDFEVINASIPEIDAKYKNPRNLCSGSVRQLNSEIAAKRRIRFIAFALVKAEGIDFFNSRKAQFEWMRNMGFDVVEYKEVNAETMEETVQWFSERISENDFPSDGLVLSYDDIAYGQSLGRTAKFPRDSIAFKWADEIRETKLLEIEWSPSRTGLINPVAIFEPVELEGTTVSRASVHNISILRGLELGIGDTIQVYKANMIIPQIADNLTRSSNLKIPKICPVCRHETEIRRINEVESLYCINLECPVKKIKSFTLFVSRDALNIEGLSEATLEKFIDQGFIKEFADIYHLSQYEDQIIHMEGFGEKSYKNLIKSIEKSRVTTLPKLIFSLGIPNVGLSNAKMICRHFDNQLELLQNASVEELSEIDGVGEVIAKTWRAYFDHEENKKTLQHLLKELQLQAEDSAKEALIFQGINFVITGSVEHFTNRNEVKDRIEALGGKVTGSVTSKTSYLINNDVASSSGKNKKAKELGIPIISEEDFIKMLEQQ